MSHPAQDRRAPAARRWRRGVPASPAVIARLGLALALVVAAATPALAAAPVEPLAMAAPPVHGTPAGSAESLAERRPDIVVLLVDDMAEIDLRVWQRLPTIQRLFVRQGVRFQRAYGNDPLCCPGRAAILTGQRTDHHGVRFNSAPRLDPSTTIATELDAVGYHTIYAGKYLSGVEKLSDTTPPGWDHTLLFSDGYWDLPYWRDGQRYRTGIEDQHYTTDLILRNARRWINQAPEDAPLFLFLSPYAVHAGRDQAGRFPGYLQPPPAPRHVGDPRCAGIPPWLPADYNEADVSDKPQYIQAKGGVPFPDGWPLTNTCEAMLSVDELLAMVEARLTALGRDDVLYLLLSDNGMTWGSKRWATKRVPYATPIPLYVHWAAGLGTERRRTKASVSNVDVAPTLCELAGCRMGPYANGYGADGVSFLPLLDGRATSLDRRFLYHEHFTARLGPRWVGVRTTEDASMGRWLYVRYETGEEELYDLEADPATLVNRASDPATATVLRRLQRRAARTWDLPWVPLPPKVP